MNYDIKHLLATRQEFDKRAAELNAELEHITKLKDDINIVLSDILSYKARERHCLGNNHIANVYTEANSEFNRLHHDELEYFLEAEYKISTFVREENEDIYTITLHIIFILEHTVEQMKQYFEDNIELLNVYDKFRPILLNCLNKSTGKNFS